MTLDGYLSRNYDDLLQAAYRIAGKDGPDLLHEVILQLYQTKQDTIDGLLERDQMKYWVLAGHGQQLQLQNLPISLQVEEGYRAPPQVLPAHCRLVGW